MSRLKGKQVQIDSVAPSTGAIAIGDDLNVVAQKLEAAVLAAQQYYYGEVTSDPVNPNNASYWLLKTFSSDEVPIGASIGGNNVFFTNNTLNSPMLEQYYFDWSIQTTLGVKRIRLT